MSTAPQTELNPRLKGFVIQRLHQGIGEWKIVEELQRQGKLDKAEAQNYVRRLGPPVYRHLCGKFRIHMVIGIAIWAVSIGLLVALWHTGVLFVAFGAMAGGMGDFSYGLFGWRRCRARLARTTVP